MKKSYQYLLFDADNTLFDFTKAEYVAFQDTCSVCNVRYSDDLCHQYSIINDHLWKLLEQGEIRLEELKIERFRQLLIASGADDDEITLEKAMKMRDNYMETLAQQTCLIDGAEEILPEDMPEEDKIVADMMIRNGNSVDITA